MSHTQNKADTELILVWRQLREEVWRIWCQRLRCKAAPFPCLWPGNAGHSLSLQGIVGELGKLRSMLMLSASV